MSETLSVSQRTIERDLAALQKSGILKREGKDNDGMCFLVKNEQKFPTRYSLLYVWKTLVFVVNRTERDL